MKKHLFLFLFAIVASIGTMVASVTIDGIAYNLNETALTAEVTTLNRSYSGNVTIPSKITYNAKTYSVTSIGMAAFYNCSSLTSVTIPNSVTSIGMAAFDNCSSLTSVTIPNSVTSVGDYAFQVCSSLTSVTIPNSVISIGIGAFADCSSLTSPVYNTHVFAFLPTSYSGAYTVPNGIESIAGCAFYECSGLISVTIPNSVTSIGSHAFYECSSLTSPVYNEHVFAYLPTTYTGAYIVPNGIESIAGGAFSGCSGLTSVTIPNSVTSIGNGAFSDCSGLTSVTMESNTPPYLGEEVFYSTKVPYIYVPCGLLETYKSAEGWSDYASKIQYIPSPYTITAKTSKNGYVSIPSIICGNEVQITANPDRGFYFVKWADGNTDNPRTIELTQDVTVEAIFDYMLTGKCGKDNALTWTLDTTTMALNITGVGELTENYTYGKFVESLTIGNSVTSIGSYAFSGCSGLNNVVFGTSLKNIEYGAFNGCPIETITCYSQRPPTVGNNAFTMPYSTIVYVPADYLTNYQMHDFWGLYDVRPIGESAGGETVSVTVNYKAQDGAALGNEPLTFHFPKVPEVAGFTFLGWQPVADIINGSITIQAVYKSIATSYTPASVSVPGNPTQKLIREGNVYILRDDKTYTLQGQEVR